jgi:hypothetical protein
MLEIWHERPHIAGLRGSFANGSRAPRYCVWSARTGTGARNNAAPLAEIKWSWPIPDFDPKQFAGALQKFSDSVAAKP